MFFLTKSSSKLPTMSKSQTVKNYSFANKFTSYKSHNSIRFKTLSDSYEKAMELKNKTKLSEKLKLQLENLIKNLSSELMNYHNEGISSRDEQLFCIFKIKSSDCYNPEKLKSIQENLKEQKAAQENFYNDCYEDYKSNQTSDAKHKLGLIEECMKHMIFGLQNQNAAIIGKHNKQQKYADDELSKIEQNHQYIFSLCDVFKEAIQQKNENPIQVVVNSLEQHISNEDKCNNNYSALHEELKLLSSKWCKQ